jgi:hypothetical protein
MPDNPVSDPKVEFYETSRYLFYRALRYLALFLYVAVVSIGSLVIDYLITVAIERTVASSIMKYPVVAQFYDWFQIGSAFLIFCAAFVHALYSAWGLIQLENETKNGSKS